MSTLPIRFTACSFLIAFSLPLFAQENTNPDQENPEDVGVITVEDEATAEIKALEHSPIPVSVVDASQFHGRNISLNDLLKRVAGVRVKQEGGLGSRSTLAIHGLEGNRVQIFLDGSPLNAPDGTFGINDIPIQFIERIEIYKGVVPAKFGGDALGGAVNVVTIDTPDGGYVDLNYSLGSYGTQRIAAIAKKSFGDHVEMGIGGFYNEAANDYIMKNVDGIEIRRNNDQFRSLVAAWVGEVRDIWFDEVGWEAVRYESSKGIQAGIQENASEIREAKDESGVNVFALEFTKDQFFNDNLEFEYAFTYVDLELNHIDKAETCYNFDGSERNCVPYGIGELNAAPSDSKDKQEELRHDLNLHYVVNDNHALNFHVNSQHSDYTPNDPLASEYLGYEAGRYESTNIGTVVSLSHEAAFLDKKLLNDFGLKSYHYDYDIVPTPKAVGIEITDNKHSGSEFGFYESIRYEAVPDLYLKASYEHAYRLPENVEVFGNGGLISPSPNLEPEESDNFNLGVLYDTTRLETVPWLKLEGNLFYRDLDNMIRLEPRAPVGSGYVNKGKVNVKGFEFEFNVDLDEHWYLYGNYTWQELLDKQKKLEGTNVDNPTYNLDMPNVAKQYANLGLEYKTYDVFQPQSILKFFWETTWVDEYFYAFELSRHQDRKIAEQISHTAGLEYTFNDEKAIISFEVQNLTDEDITDVYNYPLMGRTYKLNLRYLWME